MMTPPYQRAYSTLWRWRWRDDNSFVMLHFLWHATRPDPSSHHRWFWHFCSTFLPSLLTPRAWCIGWPRTILSSFFLFLEFSSAHQHCPNDKPYYMGVTCVLWYIPSILFVSAVASMWTTLKTVQCYHVSEFATIVFFLSSWDDWGLKPARRFSVYPFGCNVRRDNL